MKSSTAEIKKASFLINEQFLLKHLKRKHGGLGYGRRMHAGQHLEERSQARGKTLQKNPASKVAWRVLGQ